MHFFLFQSLTQTLLYDLIRHLMSSFTETDIEILIFLLHNIGLQLRKEDPVSLRDLLTLSEQKKNSLQAEIKMSSTADSGKDLDSMKRLERKVGFLNMELQDIKNNKGTMTLQVKSVEHLQTWIKKSASIKSELLIQPLNLSQEILQSSLKPTADVIRTLWWTGDDRAQVLEP